MPVDYKKEIQFGTEARNELMKGINTLADAVTCTLGPNGRNVLIDNSGYDALHPPTHTKDGVTVARNITVDGLIPNLGAQMVKQAALQTADKAGDGTTTSTLLARELVSAGLKHLNNGENAIEIKRNIETAVNEVVNTIKNNSKEISGEEQLQQIATISANNDIEIGKLIATAIDKVGRDGVVHIEESKSGDTYLETVEGMQFDRGYKEALATLIVNKARGILKVAAVKAPDFGDRKKLILEDIATLTGGTVFDKDKGMKLDKFSYDWFGQARTVTVTKEQTTIVDGKGGEDNISNRVDDLQKQIDQADTPYIIEQLQNRLAKMIGGVSIIHVGGYTETEMSEKKDRVDDALHATKAALEAGIVPGGGAALLYARETITQGNVGAEIVYKACGKPFETILTNAGYTSIEAQMIGKHQLVESSNDVWKGYDLKTEEIVNMEEAGILDPAKVTITALQNAASVAGTILLTECVVVDHPKQAEMTPSGQF